MKSDKPQLSADTIHINSLTAMAERTPNDQELGIKVRAYLSNISVQKNASLKTSHEWLQEYNYSIIDFAGWDSANFPKSYFDEKVTKQEFEKRLFASSHKIKNNKQ